MARASGLVYLVRTLKSLPHNRQSISLLEPRLQALTTLPSIDGNGSRQTLIFLSRHHDPDDACHFVGQRDSGNHARLATAARQSR
jgi:hypothetical protein